MRDGCRETQGLAMGRLPAQPAMARMFAGRAIVCIQSVEGLIAGT